MVTFIKVLIYLSIYIGLIASSFYVISFLSDKKKKRSYFSESELPIVSVIIPAYNEEKTIALTLDSIINSDYPINKLEIMVVDDGSKDKTLKIADTYIKKGVRVFGKKINEGKGSALNYGIKKAKGEIIITMDADTTINQESLKKMIKYFKDPEIMAVTPAIITRKPKNTLQRVQYMEYLTGLFLRKTFAALNAIHITPGAFSAYRKSFFNEYGGYDEKNITEDLELALRIQFNHFKIENADDAVVYTNPPEKFSHLLKQRRRWYVGLMRNIWKYNKMFGRRYGDLGMFVLPVAWISIFFSIFIFAYYFIKTIIDIGNELIFYKSINFDLGNLFDFNTFVLERAFIRLITNPIIWFLLIFMTAVVIYTFYASKKTKESVGLLINLPLFFILFAPLFAFWWVVSILYILFNKNVSWK